MSVGLKIIYNKICNIFFKCKKQSSITTKLTKNVLQIINYQLCETSNFRLKAIQNFGPKKKVKK